MSALERACTQFTRLVDASEAGPVWTVVDVLILAHTIEQLTPFEYLVFANFAVDTTRWPPWKQSAMHMLNRDLAHEPSFCTAARAYWKVDQATRVQWIAQLQQRAA
jgi:hypothetical protein